MSDPYTGQKIVNVKLSGSPAACQGSYQNDWVFYQGPNYDGTLWYSSCEWMDWTKNVKIAQVPATTMSESPSAVNWFSSISGRSSIYVFYQGISPKGSLRYNVLSRDESWSGIWSGDKQVPDVAMRFSPSAVVDRNKIYIFYHGFNDDRIWYNVLVDGITWEAAKTLPNATLTDSPSAVKWPNGSGVFLVYQGVQNSGTVWWSWFDGKTWTDPQQIPGRGPMTNPCAFFYRNKPHVLFSRQQFIGYQGLTNLYENQVLKTYNDMEWPPKKPLLPWVTAMPLGYGGITVWSSTSLSYVDDSRTIYYHAEPWVDPRPTKENRNPTRTDTGELYYKYIPPFL